MNDTAGDTLNDSSSAATLSPTSAASSGTSAAGSASTGQVADLALFINYLKQFVPVLLDTTAATALEFERTLHDKSYSDCLKKFLADPQTKSLIFQKFVTKGIHLIQVIPPDFYFDVF